MSFMKIAFIWGGYSSAPQGCSNGTKSLYFYGCQNALEKQASVKALQCERLI